MAHSVGLSNEGIEVALKDQGQDEDAIFPALAVIQAQQGSDTASDYSLAAKDKLETKDARVFCTPEVFRVSKFYLTNISLAEKRLDSLVTKWRCDLYNDVVFTWLDYKAFKEIISGDCLVPSKHTTGVLLTNCSKIIKKLLGLQERLGDYLHELQSMRQEIIECRSKVKAQFHPQVQPLFSFWPFKSKGLKEKTNQEVEKHDALGYIDGLQFKLQSLKENAQITDEFMSKCKLFWSNIAEELKAMLEIEESQLLEKTKLFQGKWAKIGPKIDVLTENARQLSIAKERSPYIYEQ